MKGNRLNSIICAALLGASLLASVWAMGWGLFSLDHTQLLVLSAVLVACGLLLLLTVHALCSVVFNLTAVPAWMVILAARHARQLALPTPRLYQLTGHGINAFALGGAGSRGTVLVYARLIRELTQDEIEAVIAHELAHLAAGHSAVMTFLHGMAMPLVLPVAVCVGGVAALLDNAGRFRAYFVKAYSVCSLLVFPLTSILIALVSRHWEYRADATAARLVGAQRYILALQCLHGMSFQQPDVLSITATAARDSYRNEWAGSHPELSRRVAVLREVS